MRRSFLIAEPKKGGKCLPFPMKDYIRRNNVKVDVNQTSPEIESELRATGDWVSVEVPGYVILVPRW